LELSPKAFMAPSGSRAAGAKAPAARSEADVTHPVAANASAPRHGEGRRAWLVSAAASPAVVVVAIAAGWDVTAWVGAVWDSLNSISPISLVAALALLAAVLSLFETGAVVVDHSARLHVRTGEAA